MTPVRAQKIDSLQQSYLPSELEGLEVAGMSSKMRDGWFLFPKMYQHLTPPPPYQQKM